MSPFQNLIKLKNDKIFMRKREKRKLNKIHILFHRLEIITVGVLDFFF